MPEVTEFRNQQQLEAHVTGPEDVNRMYVCTGIASVWMSASGANNTRKETWTFLVGPTFGRRQFERAIASASVVDITYSGSDPAQQIGGRWMVHSADADWDDESGRVQVRMEVEITSHRAGTAISLNGLSYHITILAAME